MAISTTLHQRHCNIDSKGTIAKTIGFILSNWATLSGMCSSHTVAAAAMVAGRYPKIWTMVKWSRHITNFEDTYGVRITSFVQACCSVIVARELSFSQLQSRASNSKVSHSHIT